MTALTEHVLHAGPLDGVHLWVSEPLPDSLMAEELQDMVTQPALRAACVGGDYVRTSGVYEWKETT